MADPDIPAFSQFPDNNMRSMAIDGVAFYADKVGRNAKNVQRYMRILAGMPVYDSQAKETLKQADITLTATLLIVRLALQQIEKQRD